MTDQELALRFAIALGLGVLLGLERERSKQAGLGFAGVRTFALIALSGALATWLDARMGVSWAPLAAFAAVALLVTSSYVLTGLKGEVGITTEVSALLSYLIGVVCMLGELRLAAMLAVASVLVLALKEWLHALARRIEAADVEATLKFLIVSVIVLPLVPDQSYGPPPWDVLNPYRIWWMVVLISAVDFASYVLVKLLGREHGVGLTGLLGGLVSSTAVTLNFTKRSRQEPALASALALGILLAWTVMLVRVLVLASVIRRELLAVLLVPLGAAIAASLVAVLWLRRRARGEATAEVSAGSNPFELGQAIRFGFLFAVVLLIARAAQTWMGEGGLYLAAALAGLTDVDAITLSMAELAGSQDDLMHAAAVAIVLAVVSNTLVKGGIAAGLGAPSLRRTLLPLALGLAALAAGLAFLV